MVVFHWLYHIIIHFVIIDLPTRLFLPEGHDYLQDDKWVFSGKKSLKNRMLSKKLKKNYWKSKIVCLSCELHEVIVLGSCHCNKYLIWTMYKGKYEFRFITSKFSVHNFLFLSCAITLQYVDMTKNHHSFYSLEITEKWWK